MKMSKELARAFIRQGYEITNPIKPHEAEIIGNILGTKRHQHGWRMLRHIFCKGCGRELSALDMFLSGLKHHSPAYIRDYLYNGAPGGGTIIYKDDKLPIIQVFTHGLEITCIQCGVVAKSENRLACDVYFYKRPPLKNGAFSMSQLMFDKVLAAAKADLKQRQAASKKTVQTVGWKKYPPG